MLKKIKIRVHWIINLNINVNSLKKCTDTIQKELMAHKYKELQKTNE